MADAWDESGARWEVRELWFIRSEALDGFRPLPPLLQSLLLFSLLLYLKITQIRQDTNQILIAFLGDIKN